MAYGSNISHERFARYLKTSPTDTRVSGETNRWLELDRAIYFAGTSKTWGGAVAFLSLIRDRGPKAVGYARLVSPEDLNAIARGENGAPAGIKLLQSLEIGEQEWQLLDVEMTETKGKYNAVLRLADIDGTPAFTFTTSRDLPIGEPSAKYKELIELSTGRKLAAAIGTNGSRNRDYLPDEIRVSTIPTKRTKAGGFSLIDLAYELSPDSSGMILGEAHTHNGPHNVWLGFKSGTKPGTGDMPLSLAESLGISFGQTEAIEIRYQMPLQFEVLGGRVRDIPPSDVIQTSHSDAAKLGRWALLTTPKAACPVRVQARHHVPVGKVRVSYALRTIASVGKETNLLSLQPIAGSDRRLLWTARLARALGESLLGAPPKALRATEGLVGDDGKQVVRVDSTALDFIGCSSGDTVVVSWAHKRALARVLLHTDVTRERMSEQLAEATGDQKRESVGDIESRLRVPVHMQVWISANLRHSLEMPPDSIVRIRRSIGHTLLKNSALLVLPIAGLVLAVMAIPGISPWVLAGIPLLAAASLLPTRM